MGRGSTKENKNKYQLAREELGLSREKASELLEIIPPERIEKIENQRSVPHPDEVLILSQKYRKPSLCNYYCSNECPIGKQYVPEVQIKELSAIVIEMLASLNSVNKTKDRLIEIAADGVISDDEIDDFRVKQLRADIRGNIESLYRKYLAYSVDTFFHPDLFSIQVDRYQQQAYMMRQKLIESYPDIPQQQIIDELTPVVQAKLNEAKEKLKHRFG